MTSHQVIPLGVAGFGALFMIVPSLALRSAGGDDLFPGEDQVHLRRMVRFAATVVIIVGATLFLIKF